MKRKNKRHDAKATPEKSPEKPSRRSSRHSKRRRKSSSSSSSPEREKAHAKHKESTVKDSSTKGNEKVRSYTPESVTEKVNKEVVETKNVDQEAGISRRSSKRHSGSEAEIDKPVKKDEGGGDKEWKEDKSFWEGDNKVEEVVEKGKEKEASVWKIQSANGAGGEIQKLKICRTRMAEVQEDSSPKRRSTRLKDSNQKTTGDECSSGNEDQSNTSENDKSSKHKHRSHASSRNSPAVMDSSKVTCDVSEDNPTRIKIHIENKSPEKASLASPILSNKDKPDESTVAVESNDNAENQEASDDVNVSNSNEKVVAQEENIENQENSEQLEKEEEVADEKEEQSCNKETEEVESSNNEVENKSNEVISETPEVVENAPEVVQNAPEVEEPEISESNKRRESQSSEKEGLQKSASVHSGSPRNAKDDSTSGSDSSDESNESDSNDSDSEGKRVKRKKGRKDGIQSTVTRQQLAGSECTTPVEDIPCPAETSGKQEPEEELEEGEAPDDEEGEIKTTIASDKENSVALESQTSVVSGTSEPIQRKRRWGASKTIRPPKKPVLCISTDSLKNLIPEAKPVPVEEVRLSVDEDERVLELGEREQSVDNVNDSEETKKKEKKEQKKDKERDRERERDRDRHREKEKEEKKSSREKKEALKISTEKASSDKVSRRICVLSDDAKKLVRSPSPARHRPSNILYITNLVRPFTVPQLRNLLARTGKIPDNGFWIDKIKSKCYVQYTDEDAAIETRHALHGVRWPVSNPRTLSVEFAKYDDMAVAQALSEETEPIPRKAEPLKVDHSVEGWLAEQSRINADRNQRRVVREWDVGKPAHPDEELDLRPSRPYEDIRDRERERDRERDRRKKDRGHRSRTPDVHEAPTRKARRKDDDAPAKLLDDLFRKTKTSPCIYWLPLTSEQIVVKEEMRRQHMAEHERRVAEMKKAEQARRDRDRDRRRK